jgi:hypothetical protein
MAATNPYTGQQGSEWYALAWDQGYAYGQQNPTQDQPSPPSIFPPLDVGADYLAYMQQVWSEASSPGALTRPSLRLLRSPRPVITPWRRPDITSKAACSVFTS